MWTTVALVTTLLWPHPTASEVASAPIVEEQSPAHAPLTLSQLRQLLSIAAPDTTIAKELEARGTAFAVDDQTLNELMRLGAGSETVEALRSLLRTMRPQKRVR